VKGTYSTYWCSQVCQIMNVTWSNPNNNNKVFTLKADAIIYKINSGSGAAYDKNCPIENNIKHVSVVFFPMLGQLIGVERILIGQDIEVYKISIIR